MAFPVYRIEKLRQQDYSDVWCKFTESDPEIKVAESLYKVNEKVVNGQVEIWGLDESNQLVCVATYPQPAPAVAPVAPKLVIPEKLVKEDKPIVLAPIAEKKGSYLRDYLLKTKTDEDARKYVPVLVELANKQSFVQTLVELVKEYNRLEQKTAVDCVVRTCLAMNIVTRDELFGTTYTDALATLQQKKAQLVTIQGRSLAAFDSEIAVLTEKRRLAIQEYTASVATLDAEKDKLVAALSIIESRYLGARVF